MDFAFTELTAIAVIMFNITRWLKNDSLLCRSVIIEYEWRSSVQNTHYVS